MASGFEYSSDTNLHVHPIDAMRLIWGPVQVKILDGNVPHFRVKGLALPDVTVSDLWFSPTEVFKRGGADNNDITITLASSMGAAYFRSGPAEQYAEGGAAIVKEVDYECTSAITDDYRWQAIRISRAAVAPLLSKTAKLQLNRIPGEFAAVGLLRHYVKGLLEGGSSLSGIEDVVASHIRDLAALVIGANRDGQHEAAAGGVMAARLQVAKRFVRHNLRDSGLSDESVAAALRISPSYVRKLFVGEGGICAFVTRERLAHAHRLLACPSHAKVKVIDIAFRCGFSSLQTFNRQFKALYGMSPSEVRAMAQLR